LPSSQLVHVHPFVDGNGRTFRLLSTLCLYRAATTSNASFAISEYYDRDRQSFYRAIQGVRESGMEMTGWLEFFVEGLARATGRGAAARASSHPARRAGQATSAERAPGPRHWIT